MRESCLIFLLFHYLTRLASAGKWQQQHCECHSSISSFGKKFRPIAEWWSRLVWAPSVHRHIPEADLCCHKFLTDSGTRPEISDPPYSFHLQSGKSEVSLCWTAQNRQIFLCPSEPNSLGFRETGSIHLLHLRGPTTKKYLMRFPPGFGTLYCVSLVFSASYSSLIFIVLIIPGFVGIDIFIIIFHFISIIKLLLSQYISLTFFWFSSSSHWQSKGLLCS